MQCSSVFLWNSTVEQRRHESRQRQVREVITYSRGSLHSLEQSMLINISLLAPHHFLFFQNYFSTRLNWWCWNLDSTRPWFASNVIEITNVKSHGFVWINCCRKPSIRWQFFSSSSTSFVSGSVIMAWKVSIHWLLGLRHPFVLSWQIFFDSFSGAHALFARRIVVRWKWIDSLVPSIFNALLLHSRFRSHSGRYVSREIQVSNNSNLAL